MVEPLRPAPRRSAPEHVIALARWIGIGRLLAVAGAVLAVGAGSFWLLRPPAGADPDQVAGTTAPMVAVPSVPDGAPGPPSSAVAATEPPAPVEVVVHVAGAVIRPGVYRLAPASRIGEAVDAAGGAAPDAQLDAVNLAAPLEDGQQVYVPKADEATGPATTTAAPGASASDPAPVDLNAATEEELLALPGVGPVTAAAILRHRTETGPFASVEQLLDVPGIGPARLASLEGLVRV